MAEHQHLAAILMNQAHDDANGCGLARAVGPDESHDLSFRDLQVNVVEREIPVVLSHSVEFYGEIGHITSFSARRSLASRRRCSSSLGLRPSSAAIRVACSRCCSNSCSRSFAPRPGVEATCEPLPCCVMIMPTRSSSKYARFTVITLTCRSTASWRIEGIACPSAQSPTEIRSL